MLEVEEGEGCAEGSPHDWISTDNVINVENTDIIEIRAEEAEDIPSPM